MSGLITGRDCYERSRKKISKLAKHLGWNLMAPGVGMFVMEELVFKSSPPTSDERTCYDLLVQKYREEELVSYEVWKDLFQPLWVKAEVNYSRYYGLLNSIHAMFNEHLEARYHKACFEELEDTPLREGYSDEDWCGRSEELSSIDSLFRSCKKSAGKALEGLLLNASERSGCNEAEMIKYLEDVAEKPIQEKIKGRKGRPNANPIWINHENDLPGLLMYTVDEVEPYYEGGLLWLKQTHSVRNRWRAFGHLVKVNERSLQCTC